MTKNPLINALTASLYIITISTVMYYGTKITGPTQSAIAPIAVLSLFTLSTAVMSYLFLYQPFLFFLDGKRKEAVNLFLKTVVVFGAITALILAALFSGLLS